MTDDSTSAVNPSVAERPLIDPEPGWNVTGARALLSTLRFVHEANPRCWSIHGDDSYGFLNVGNIIVFSLYSDGRIGLAVDRTTVPEEAAQHFEALRLNSTYKSEPNIEFVRSADNESGVPRLLELFGESHRDTVKSISAKWRINMRWKWYSTQVASEIGRITGEPVPEPGYAEELAALKLVEYSSNSSETSDLNIADMYPIEFIEQMARSILVAHELDPNSWSLFSTNDRIALNVGQRTVGGSAKVGFYDFVVDGSLLGEDQRQLLSTNENPALKPGFSKEESLLFLQLPAEIGVEHLDGLQAAHEAALRILVNPGSKANLWKDHQEYYRQVIEGLTNSNLPAPAYLPPPPTGRYWAFCPVYTGTSRALRIDIGRDQSVVGIDTHAWEEQISLDDFPAEVEGFKESLRKVTGYGRDTIEPAWRFRHELSVGDKVVLVHRNRSIRWGEVTGKYVADPNAPVWQHRRPVKWNAEISRPIDDLPEELKQRLWSRGQNDPLELTADQFAVLIGKEDQSTPSPIVPKALIASHFVSHGLSYSDAQIATFYTALQTKGFVVLSGISGTGKSKIAQHFVELMPNPAAEPADVVKDEGVISFTLKPYSKKYKRVVLPVRQVDVLPAITLGSARDVRVTFGGDVDVCRIENRVHTSGRPLHVLYFRGEISRAIQTVATDTRMYLRPIFDDDGDKLRQLDLLTDMPPLESSPSLTSTEVENHLFLSVRPDWRDSTSLLGYFNPLTERYQWTDFLLFILRAVRSYEQRDRLAWFVILDEMNLAHVEYYFADLLSVIESGRQGQGDKLPGFSREPLRISFAETVDDDVPPREIFLPPNLYIIGTVNMDETTHAFSPKVLDRAFTIELTEVDFTDFPPAVTQTYEPIPDETKQAMLRAFTREGRFHEIDKAAIAGFVATHPGVRDRLQRLNQALTVYQFQFGYRIFDEICQYLANNEENGMASFNEAFDAAVSMKVLPKFTGSRARLRSPLLNLLAWAIDPDVPDDDTVIAEFESQYTGTSEWLTEHVDNATLPRLARRTLAMLNAVERDGFVAFG